MSHEHIYMVEPRFGRINKVSTRDPFFLKDKIKAGWKECTSEKDLKLVREREIKEKRAELAALEGEQEGTAEGDSTTASSTTAETSVEPEGDHEMVTVKEAVERSENSENQIRGMYSTGKIYHKKINNVIHVSLTDLLKVEAE